MRRVSLSVRVRPDVRDWLVARGVVERRSLGQVVELLVEAAMGKPAPLGSAVATTQARLAVERSAAAFVPDDDELVSDVEYEPFEETP